MWGSTYDRRVGDGNGTSTCQTDRVAGQSAQPGDRHVDPKLTIRPTEELRRAALDLLKQRGLTAQDFMIACLSALVADPDRQIEAVASHWPEPKTRGRPRKRADTEGQ